MKKLLVCFCMLLLATGCSKDSTPKQVTCKGNLDGQDTITVISAEGDEVLKEDIEMKMDLSSMVDLSSLSDADKENLTKTLDKTFKDELGIEMEGVTISSELSGNEFIARLSIDYTIADAKELQDAEIIEGGFYLGLSLEKSIENYKEMGLSCN